MVRSRPDGEVGRRSFQARLRVLAARRRRVTRHDVAAFGRGLLGPYRLSVLRSACDGALVFATLERRGLRPLLRRPPAVGRIEDVDGARRIAEAVDAGLRLLPVLPTCLRRSVTLLRELERRGLSGTLVLGVRTGRSVEAHAWVTVAGTVVNDDPALIATYALLASGDAERLLPTFV